MLFRVPLSRDPEICVIRIRRHNRAASCGAATASSPGSDWRAPASQSQPRVFVATNLSPSRALNVPSEKTHSREGRCEPKRAIGEGRRSISFSLPGILAALAREGGMDECARLPAGAAPELAEARLADPRLIAFAAPQRFLLRSLTLRVELCHGYFFAFDAESVKQHSLGRQNPRQRNLPPQVIPSEFRTLKAFHRCCNTFGVVDG